MRIVTNTETLRVSMLSFMVCLFLCHCHAAIFFLTEGRRAIKVFKVGQNPLPGEKVFRPTRYKYGFAAKIQPLSIFAIILFFIVMSIWGSFQADELTTDIKPCTVELSFNQIKSFGVSLKYGEKYDQSSL